MKLNQYPMKDKTNESLDICIVIATDIIPLF